MKVMKTVVLTVAAVLMIGVLFAGAVSADASGNCGKQGSNLQWAFSDSTKTLTITGSGEMGDYGRSSDIPWDANRSSITSVKLPNGLQNIGNYAFYQCTALKSIEIPASVTTIGVQAINNCINLTTLTLAKGSKLKTIGDSAFGWCIALKSIEIPASVTTIGGCAFYWTGITSIEIPASVTSIGESAFNSCWYLTDVTFADVSKLKEIGKEAFGPSGIKKVTINAGEFSSDPALFGTDVFIRTNLACVISKELQNSSVMSNFVVPGLDNANIKPVWYVSEIQTASLPASYDAYYIGFLNGGKLASSFTQDEKKLPTADAVILRDGYVLEGWYDDATLETKHSGTSIVAGSPVYAKYKVYTAEKTTDATGTATFGGNNVLALKPQSAVSTVVLDSVSGLGKDTTVTFVADNIKVGEIPELSGYTRIEDVSIFEINVEDKVSGSATFEVTVTFASQKDAAEYGDKVRFVHYVAGAWQTYPLESTAISKDGASIRYKVTTTSFSPFGISIQSKNPNRGHSASIPKDYTPSSSVPVMVQETVKPTTAPTLAAPTAMPTSKPTTQQTQKSPAPFVGLVAGLGAAALVLARMRR